MVDCNPSKFLKRIFSNATEPKEGKSLRQFCTQCCPKLNGIFAMAKGGLNFVNLCFGLRFWLEMHPESFRGGWTIYKYQFSLCLVKSTICLSMNKIRWTF